ncbi:MAG: 1,4-alpha-glucan branching protein GlgB, partial [Bacteroidetes bacterium]
FKRKGKKASDDVLVVMNMTPEVRKNWKIEVTGRKNWKEIFNSNSTDFWGTGDVFNPKIPAILVDKPSQRYQLTIHLPALAAVVLK